jgi:hypothetical protein
MRLGASGPLSAFKMTVCSFHTSKYSAEAARLAASLERAGITEVVLSDMIDSGDWYANTAKKANYLLDMRSVIRGPLVWLDADAVVHRDFQKDFEPLECDMHMRQFRGTWLTGTIFMADTEACIDILKSWVAYNDAQQIKGNKEGGGQANLNRVIEQGGPWTVGHLAEKYCHIFDLDKGEPVIEHLQASREFHWFTRAHDAEPLQRRNKRLKEVDEWLQ